MSTWNVTEITLSADYIGHEPDSVTIPCRSLSLSPPQFMEESGAGGSKQTSMVKPAVISAAGVDASVMRSLKWSPTRLTFRDTITGANEFRIKGFSISPQNEVSLSFVDRVKVRRAPDCPHGI